jgi:hypothetical protein
MDTLVTVRVSSKILIVTSAENISIRMARRGQQTITHLLQSRIAAHDLHSRSRYKDNKGFDDSQIWLNKRTIITVAVTNESHTTVSAFRRDHRADSRARALYLRTAHGITFVAPSRRSATCSDLTLVRQDCISLLTGNYPPASRPLSPIIILPGRGRDLGVCQI